MKLVPGKWLNDSSLYGEAANMETEGNHNTTLALWPWSKAKVKTRLSPCERREFRWWFWRKKGGMVRSKEYADKSNPRGRWETHYILPGMKKPLRSWKKCVEFLGIDPDPSTTSWALQRSDEEGLAPVEIIPRQGSTAKRMRGQLTTSPIIITTAGAPTSISATSRKVDNCASVGPVHYIESRNVGHPNILLLGQETTSEDSSNQETLSLRNEQGRLGALAAYGSGYKYPRSKHCIQRKLSIGNGALQLRTESAEGKEERLEDFETANMQSRLPKQNKTVSSSVQNQPLNGTTETRRRRVLMLNPTSEETTVIISEAKASTISKDEGHSAEHPRFTKQISATYLVAPNSAASTLKLSSTNVASKENGNHRSEKNDHNKSHPPENVVISCEESNCGPREEVDEGSILNVDDETLQKNLINLLYADHIKQPSKQTYSDVIGKLYAEFIERSFARNQNINCSRKREELHLPRQSRPSSQISGRLKTLQFTGGDLDTAIPSLAERVETQGR